MNRPILTADRLRELLHYDPETGVFTWRRRQGRARKGDEAGHIVTYKSGGKNGGTYRQIRVLGRLYLAHRLAFLWMTEEWPADEVDHKDRDGLNNRWGNLRPSSSLQNKGNRARQHNNKAGFKGVYHIKETGRYRAQMSVGNKSLHIGCFDTPEEASAAYAAKAKEIFGEFARADK